MNTTIENKYDISNVKKTMMAVVTMGNGGYDQLNYTEVPMPVLESGEVLIKVLAAGVNNTEINTRLGWYSDSVVTSTDNFSANQLNHAMQKSDGGWNEATPFPFIQGTDCCGIVVSSYNDKYSNLIDKRVIVRPCMRKTDFTSYENIWMASDFDGAFAQYVKVPANEVFVVESNWSDAELATIPCAYGTSENMIERAQVNQGSTLLISGASGGVGSASIQLAKRRGAKVIAITNDDKAQLVKSIGADVIISRQGNLLEQLDGEQIDIAIDNVAGSGFADIIKAIRRGGKYVSSGAIAGPIVALDMRDFYLKDITLIGCTAWAEVTFTNLVRYIENEEIKPLVAKTFSLCEIAEAQSSF